MAIAVREVVTASSEGTTQVNLGAGTVAGDLLLLTNGTDFYTVGDMGTPSGGGTWNGPVATADQGTNDFHSRVWWAVAAAAGAQSITVDQPNPGSDNACNHVRVRVLTGADTADPIDDAAGSTADQTAPALTPTTADALLCCDVLGGSGTYTSPGSMVAEPQQNCGSFSTSDGAHEQLDASGDTGTRPWNAGSVGTSVAVRTAAGGGVAGDGASVAPAGTGAGAAAVAVAADGSAVAVGPAAAGSGVPTVAGTGAGVAPAGLASGAGQLGAGSVSGAGQATTPPGVAAGVGTVLVSGFGAAVAPAGVAAGVETLVAVVTPAERTVTVPAEPRRLAVAADLRTLTIPAEERTLHV